MRLYNGFLRKISSLLFILAICTPFLYPFTEVRSDSFTLQAGYDKVSAIYIEPIAAQSAAYIAGMPFNIEDSLVAPIDGAAGGVGRRIANFNLLSNTDFELHISGEPMHHETKDGVVLNYILTFDCELGFYSGSSISYNSYSFTFNSADKKKTWDPGMIFDDGSFVGTVDGNISFIFDIDAIDAIHNGSDIDGDGVVDELPSGNYEAVVTVSIISTGDSVL